jgi:tetratricopeptide (TPR) repeat protein
LTARRLGLALAALVALGALGADPAGAQPDADGRAKAASAFKQGQAYFKNGDFDRALAEYQVAFDLSAEPSLIFNIGLCHDRASRPEQALEAFRRYLELAPDGDVAEEAREEVARLAPIVDKRAADRAAKLVADREAARAAEEARRREAERRAIWEKATAPPSRVPLVIMVGGAAVVAVGGVFHAMAGQTRKDIETTSDPDVYFAGRDTFETRRAVAIGAYAAGAVTMATGLILRLTVYRRPDMPQISAAVAPGGAMVAVEWSR